jgi:hypothetical protein
MFLLKKVTLLHYLQSQYQFIFLIKNHFVNNNFRQRCRQGCRYLQLIFSPIFNP